MLSHTIHSLILFCIGKFVIYPPCAWVIIPLRHDYIYICMDMFVNSILVYALTHSCIFIQYTHSVYFILGIWLYIFYISTVHGLLHHCIIIIYVFVLVHLWILYLCLQKYVCVLYTIYSFFVIYLGKIVVYI